MYTPSLPSSGTRKVEVGASSTKPFSSIYEGIYMWPPFVFQLISPQFIFWILALAEIAAIIASNNDRSPISQKVLGAMLLTSNTNGLRVAPLSAIGAFLSLCGGAIRLACYRWMGKHFTFDVSIRDHHKLITTGPYGIVRHPGYTGALLNVLGLYCFHASPGSLLRVSELLNISSGRISVGLLAMVMLVPLPFMRHRMRMEDMALKREFGQDWEDWAKKVPYWLVPGLY